MIRMPHRALPWRRGAVGAVITALALLTAACGGGLAASSNASGDAYTELRTGKAGTAADAKALKGIPASVRNAYAGFWHATRIGPNPYAGWKAPKAPWKFCYSSAYQGNTWRQEGLKVAQGIVADFDAKGLADGKLLASDANNNASLQATQITTMAQKGCDVILVMQPPTVGVCKAFQTAKDAGALVVVMQTGTDCTNVIQSDFGAYYAGQKSAQWLVDKIGDTGGTVVMCDGIPGVAAAEARQAGAADVFAKAGLKVDHITGQWTPSTVKSEMLRYLSTHQGALAGVWDGGVCAAAVTEALQQAGRKLPWVTGFEGGCPWLATWKETGKESFGFAASAGDGVEQAFRIALRMLAGQKPKYNTLLYPLAEITSTNFNQYHKAGMTLNSACFAQPAGGGSVPDSYYDALFTGGKQPQTFDAHLSDLPVK